MFENSDNFPTGSPLGWVHSGAGSSLGRGSDTASSGSLLSNRHLRSWGALLPFGLVCGSATFACRGSFTGSSAALARLRSFAPVRRPRRLIAAPPGDGWDGAWRFDQK